MDKRKLRLEKYGISSKRYKELCGFCEQYPDWKAFIANNKNPLKGQSFDGMPFSKTNNNSDQTANLAMKLASMEEKIKLIEDTAKEAAPDTWECLIKSVCYEQPFWYIRDIIGIPLNSSSFYDRRRYFFYLLDKKR